VSFHERLRNGLCGLKQLVKFPFRFDGRHDVQALAACRFDEGVIAITFEVPFEFHGQFRHLRKRETLRRIEVVDDVIGLVEVRRARMHLVQLDAGQVRQPHQRRGFGGDDVILFLFTKDH
jgi:hypothetical protein